MAWIRKDSFTILTHVYDLSSSFASLRFVHLFNSLLKPIKSGGDIFTGVEYHTDSSQITYILSLSEKDVEFSGGGTYFQEAKTRVDLGIGQALIFPGGTVRHKGEPITSGNRVLFVGFLEKKCVGVSESRPLEGREDSTSSSEEEIPKKKRSKISQWFM